MREKVHVLPHKKGWAVKKDSKARASRISESKKEAEEYARDMAKALKAELVIHDKHVVIQNSNSYGHDPMPPRG